MLLIAGSYTVRHLAGSREVTEYQEQPGGDSGVWIGREIDSGPPFAKLSFSNNGLDNAFDSIC
jgi:hypothetical protein